MTIDWRVELGTDGDTILSDYLVLRPLTSSSGANPTNNCGTVRVRVFGYL